jgi:hypothetical protein
MSGTGGTTGRGSVPGDDSKQPGIAGKTGGPGEDVAGDPSRPAEDAGEAAHPHGHVHEQVVENPGPAALGLLTMVPSPPSGS